MRPATFARAAMRGLAVLIFAAPASALGAQGWVVPRPCLQPEPELRPDDRPRPLPCPPIGTSIVRTRSDVRVTLDGRVARWEVEERFVNRGGGLGEADYVFPLPEGAAFKELQLSIDGRMVAGETMNANEARRIYEEIVRRQRDPALVEWMGHGLLRARIFPLPPGEEKRVVVRFTSVIEREGDAMRVDYARGSNAGPRSPVAGSRGPRTEDRGTTFTLSYPLSAQYGRPYSPTHELDVHDADGMRRVEARGAGDVTVLLPIRRGGAAAITTLAYAPGGEDGFALITVSPPTEAARAPMPRDVTFVLDVSGSMSGQKMEQARAAGRQFLATLRPSDRFQLVDFSTDVRTFRDSAVAATPENLRQARRYLDALEANGSTNIAGALDAALRDRSADDDGRLHVVLFVTDGEPTVGERRPEELARLAARERGDTRIFTFGLGADVNVALLERLALDGGGTAQFVRPDESVERTVGLVASRIVEPVLTDVHVRLDGDDDLRLEKMHPSLPTDLFAGQDLVVLARYRGHGAARVIVEGRRRGAVVRWTTSADFPERERDNAFVARLWAVQRIGYLSAERREHGGNPELDDEIRTLGERFGIPTEFTAYLVREPVVAQVRRRDMGMNQPAPAAAPTRDESFMAAKAAAEQRAARSIAAAESVVPTSAGAAGEQRRTVGDHSFVLRDGRWTDVAWRDGLRTVRVKAYGKAYFDVLQRLPELARPLALGERVLVAGARVAVEVSGEGASELSPAELDRLVNDWR